MTASRRLLTVLLLAVASATFLSSSSQAQGSQVLCVHDVVPPDQLSVRAGPSSAAPLVGRYPAGACGVELVGQCRDGWCEMALGGVAGWVYTKHIAVYEAPPGYAVPRAQAVTPVDPRVEQGSGEPTMCVSRVDRGDTLRIRTGPGTGHDEIGGIPPGACGVGRVGGCRGAWCKVAWRGLVGWVNTYYLD